MRRPPILLAALLAAAAPAPAQDAKPPEEKPKPVLTMDQIRGMRVEILSPPESWKGTRSLLVFLHDHSSTGKAAAVALEEMASRGFIVVAPSSREKYWSNPELETVKGIVRDLVDRYAVPRERRHLGAHWTGAGDLGVLAFDEAVGFRTCTWMNAVWAGGSVGKWAKEGLCGLFLWGAKEGPGRVDNYRRAESALAEKVRVCVGRGERQEPGLGRAGKKGGESAEMPASLFPFWAYFLECMEGRYVHGQDLSFDWTGDLEAARTDMAVRKTGGFVYVWSKDADAAEIERTRVLQNEAFFDHVLRRFGDQLVAVRLERADAKALLEQAKVEATPAVIVLKKGGKEIQKAVSGDVSAKALVPLLRSVAPDPEMPK